MSLLSHIPLAEPDPILGLSDSFRQDPRPYKINLSVGIYQDARGRSPVLGAVRTAEAWLLKSGDGKNYLPISGDRAYLQTVQHLLLPDADAATRARLCTVQTPGGTGGLRIAGDFLASLAGIRTVWVSDPTWANHYAIFKAAGMDVRSYPYYDASTQSLHSAALFEALAAIPAGQAVLLHGCCHNPSGIDPDAAQWQRIADLCRERNLLPIIDFAYQGFGDGLQEDALAIRIFAASGQTTMVVSSFSKNFGLYQDRIGALTVLCSDEEEQEVVLSQLKAVIRANYSNPPAHGAAIIATILSDEELKQEWQAELNGMRARILAMRQGLVDAARRAGIQRDFSFLLRQKGMFSFSGLTKEQVRLLREQHAIYIVGSGRINVAGLNDDNLPVVCEAIRQVIG